MLLAYFPTPYPGELLYSVLARYHRHTCCHSIKLTLEELYGIRTVTAVVDLPSHLRRLSCNLPIGIELTPEEIIHQFTLFPYYTAFTTPRITRQVLASMLSNQGGDIHTRLGIAASSVGVPAYLRYCPECREENLSQYGECYWHRVHQLPSVFVCPVHGLQLEDSRVPYMPFNKHEYVAADSGNCRPVTGIRGVILPEKDLKHLHSIAVESEKLLESAACYRPLSYHSARYRQALAGTALSKGASSVDQYALAYRFEKHFGKNVLRLLQSDVRYDSDACWLKAISRKHRKSFHPVRHLLFSLFLAEISANESLSGEPSSPSSNFSALHRHDGKAEKRNTQAAKTVKVRVDWAQRDIELASRVPRLVESLTKLEKPVRITRTMLGKHLGKPAMIEKHLTKMPRTKRLIEQLSESVEQFQARRIRWAVKKLQRGGKEAVVWRIMRLAGLTAKHSDMIEKLMSDQVEKIRIGRRLP